ncbi:DeoR/GlpR family DNA-binding transcription regulator [Streptomyces sp. NPDC059398]|uniref:DeoR/GlpR family DNA-binding transcription regulator n=1 Tax=Streptomyces sp. NPDC059398 TaxID=3346820 RepID=UPI00367A7C49
MSSQEEGQLIPDQRRELLLRRLRSHLVLSVHQLTEMLGVSHMTVRRDIAALEEQGHVYSVPGGVRLASRISSEPSHERKTHVDRAEKTAMAALVDGLLVDGMSVYVDAGTTLLHVVPFITARQGMTVVTNDFTVVHRLADAPHVETIHIGGRLEHENLSTVGPVAAATLRQFALDLALISSSSWDLQRGVTTPSEAKVEVKRAAMESASRSVLVAAASKYGLFATYRMAPLRAFERIVTDRALEPAAAQAIRDLGIELDLATP